MDKELEAQIKSAYVEYMKMPLATDESDDDPALNPDTNEIYSNWWYVQEGMSFVAPHPHRHFTYNEFLQVIQQNSAFRNRFNIPEFV